VAGGSLDLGNTPFVSFGPTIGNVGIEGISYDPRNSSFVTAKQDTPAQLSIFNSLAFATLSAPDVVPDTQFSGASSVLGLNSLSDVQTLGILEALAGAAVADHVLVLSLDSRRLIEIDRLGNTFSSFDLTGVVPRNAIEGVTIAEDGTIYLVAEQDQMAGAPPNPQSQLIVLKPVPEPATYSMMLIGVGMLGLVAHRRRRAALAIR
jgi:uncharacterized protein YjiK